jgi:anti-anti-sigma factor
MQTLPPVVEVTGELDLSTVARWEEDVEAVGRRASLVVLDLSRVGFVDSAGVRTLFRLIRAAQQQGTRLVFVAPRDGPVRRLLDILDLEALTPVCETRAEAVRAGQSPPSPQPPGSRASDVSRSA